MLALQLAVVHNSLGQERDMTVIGNFRLDVRVMMVQ